MANNVIGWAFVERFTTCKDAGVKIGNGIANAIYACETWTRPVNWNFYRAIKARSEFRVAKRGAGVRNVRGSRRCPTLHATFPTRYVNRPLTLLRCSVAFYTRVSRHFDTFIFRQNHLDVTREINRTQIG